MSRLCRTGISISRGARSQARPFGGHARLTARRGLVAPAASASLRRAAAPMMGSVARTNTSGGGAQQRRSFQEQPQFDILHEQAIGSRNLKVVQGDICQIPAEAVVHPTNGKLSLIGGVGTALKRACGPDLSRDIREWKEVYRKLPVAGTCHTPAHNIHAKHVIHVHSPRWRGNSEVSLRQLGDAVANIFKEAEGAGLASVAMPALGSGVNAFPKEDAVRTILYSIQDHFASTTGSSVQEIYFVLFDVESIDAYKHGLGMLESGVNKIL